MGKYLTALFKDNLKSKISAKSGTLNTYYKNKLAKLFTDSDSISWDDLSEEAKDLTRSIYAFIKKQNAHF